MPAPNDRNSRIALAKGWTWHEEDFFLAPNFGSVPELRTHWLAPIRNGERYAEPETPPDFVGTLEGVSGMMRELQEKETAESVPEYDWALRWSPLFQLWDVWAVGGSTRTRLVQFQSTKEEGFGVAVGDAWMSVHGKKEAADASTD